MIAELLYNNLKTIDGLFISGYRVFMLPNSKIIVKITPSYYDEVWKPLNIIFEKEGKVIWEFNTSAGGGDYYNISWSENERFFSITDISQWYEDLYILDLHSKDIIYEVTGLEGLDGSRAIAFHKNLAIILPTLNYEGGVSDFKIINCETKEVKTLLTSMEAVHNNLLTEDFVITPDSKYLVVKSNLYLQQDIYSEEEVRESKTLGFAMANLLNTVKCRSTYSCIELESLVNNHIFKVAILNTNNLSDSKLLSEIKSNTSYNIFTILETNKKISIEIPELTFKTNDLFKPIKLNGDYEEGYSLSVHTLSSRMIGENSFETERSELGQLLYEYKYCGNHNAIYSLSKMIIPMLDKLLVELCLGKLRRIKDAAVIPIPPSNTKRTYQPVYELAREIFSPFKLLIDTDYLNKKSTPELKGIEDLNSRKEILKDAFTIKDKRYKGKSIILFDDLFRSGETLNAASKVLKEQGEVNNIFALTITKTRTKK